VIERKEDGFETRRDDHIAGERTGAPAAAMRGSARGTRGALTAATKRGAEQAYPGARRLAALEGQFRERRFGCVGSAHFSNTQDRASVGFAPAQGCCARSATSRSRHEACPRARATQMCELGSRSAAWLG